MDPATGYRSLLRWITLVVAGAGLSLRAGPRLDQVQVIGTHNSYHIAPHPSIEALLRERIAEKFDALDYSHRPLTDQLDRLGVRQVELDLYADPNGGLFADPAGIRIAAERGMSPVPPVDQEVMRRPGTKILHVPDFDFQTTARTLRDALVEMDRWSTNHPAHVPIFVLLELKSEAAGDTQPVAWNAPLLDALEAEILEVLPRHRLLIPDEVRGAHPTLRAAVLNHGWPPLATARGRFVLLLDNTDSIRDLYLARSATLSDRLFFVSVGERHPAAAWFKINDPVADFGRIQELVRQGFLVRTRADVDTEEAHRQDFRRRDAAWESGAQMVSTDFPEPNPSLGDYTARWPEGQAARGNPVSGSALRQEWDLEELAIRGLEPFEPLELRLLNDRARQFHSPLRRLAEASADYRRLLELQPPQPPSPNLAEIILGLAPLLDTHSQEPFPLRDVVAVHHPSQPLIGYHFFWADDIDFPEDNDPADHEVVWVSYDPVSHRPLRVFTYFHGRILQAACHEDRPRCAVEWGKHGTLPLDSRGEVVDPALLRAHWERLHTKGIRLAEHPLARSWPRRFAADWPDYLRFNARVDSRTLLQARQLIWISDWPNAVLDQYALSYNFAAKTEWPE